MIQFQQRSNFGILRTAHNVVRVIIHILLLYNNVITTIIFVSSTAPLQNTSTITTTTNATTITTTTTTTTISVHNNGTFLLIDSNTLRSVGRINDTISYYNIRSSTHLFNIRYISPNVTTVTVTNTKSTIVATNRTITVMSPPQHQNIRFNSTLFIFENAPSPRRVYCDTTPVTSSSSITTTSFRLFEHNTNGTAYGNILYIGRGVLTATPYTGARCTGTSGPKLTKIFFITGCRYDITTTKISTGRRYYFVTQNAVLPSHTCNTSTIESFTTTLRARHIYCGFPEKEYTLSLYNRTTSTTTRELVADETVRRLPLYVFGNKVITGSTETTTTLPSGNIRPGSYSVILTINGIPSQTINFTITNQCFVDFDAGE